MGMKYSVVLCVNPSVLQSALSIDCLHLIGKKIMPMLIKGFSYTLRHVLSNFQSSEKRHRLNFSNEIV